MTGRRVVRNRVAAAGVAVVGVEVAGAGRLAFSLTSYLYKPNRHNIIMKERHVTYRLRRPRGEKVQTRVMPNMRGEGVRDVQAT